MSVDSTAILKNHYEWCKENGRNTSWYKKKKKGLLPITMMTAGQKKLIMRSYKGCK